MTELLHKYLDTDLVRVVNGSIPETTKVCVYLTSPVGSRLITDGVLS
jgi:hypothetical protein